MFILDGGLARILSSFVASVKGTKGKDETEKEASKKPSENVTFGEVKVEENSSLLDKDLVPPKLFLTQQVLKKIDKLGLSDKQKGEIARIVSKSVSDSDAPKISKYLTDDRYELIFNFGNTKTNDISQAFSNIFGEEYAQLLRLRFLADKETREIEKVLTLLSFSTSNPKGVISSLKNLLSSLITPAALQMAGSAMSDVTSFYAGQLTKEAVYDPENARKDANDLSLITGSIPEHLAIGHEGINHVHENNIGHIDIDNIEGYVHQSISFLDKETNEIVDEFVIYSDEYAQYGDEDVHDAAHEAINSAQDAIDPARKSLYEVNRIADNVETEEAKKLEAKIELRKIQDKIANSKNDREIRELTALEKSISKFIGYA